MMCIVPGLVISQKKVSLNLMFRYEPGGVWLLLAVFKMFPEGLVGNVYEKYVSVEVGTNSLT